MSQNFKSPVNNFLYNGNLFWKVRGWAYIPVFSLCHADNIYPGLYQS